jgi:hypothetical protein
MSAFGRTLTPRPRGKGKLVWEENWIRKAKRDVSTTSLHQWPTFRPPFKTCYPQIPLARLLIAGGRGLDLFDIGGFTELDSAKFRIDAPQQSGEHAAWADFEETGSGPRAGL